MDIDINTWRGIATLLVMIAFLGVCAWAYSSKRKVAFDAAAQIPFADEKRDVTYHEQHERGSNE